VCVRVCESAGKTVLSARASAHGAGELLTEERDAEVLSGECNTQNTE